MRSALSAAKVTSLLGIFLAVSVLMGVIAAGLAAPVVGAAGLAAREGVGMFDRLPGDLEQNPLAQQSRILAADGSILATPAKQNRIIVESDEISEHMKNAQVAIEDERFFEHGGMDVEALARAVVSNATTDNTQGGSTLTQQYIKMALQAEAIKEQDADALQQLNARSGMDGYIRKLRELKYAVTLEERLTKEEILVGYLNLAFYGDNVYGVEAAARHYFDVRAKDLSIAQAATLAGIVRAPTSTNPVADVEVATARRNTVLDKMVTLEMITQEEYEAARESDIELTLTDSQRSCINSPNPYFCDYVTAWLLQQPALGATQDERFERLTTEGLTITTTLDRDLSAEMGEILRETTPENDYNVASAATIIQPGTGHVLAFNQSSEYSFDESGDKVSSTSVNWNVDTEFGGPGGMEIGSVAKTYTVVEALEKGVPVETTLEIEEPGLADENGVWLDNPEDPETPEPGGETHPVGVFEKDDFQEECTIGEDYWTVRNALDQNHDPEIELRTAVGLSVNTAFATLASQVGTCDIVDTMTELGLRAATGEEFSPFPPAIVLGSDYASPMTVATSYAALAAGGMYCAPLPVTKIVDSDGEEIPLETPECERVVDEEVALGTVELLKEVVQMTGSGWTAILDGDRPAAGKTGTNNNSSHTFFAGFTPQLSTAVFVGVPTGAALGDERVDMQIGDRFIEGPLFGSSLAAPTWKAIMEMAHAELPVEDWEEPSDEILNGKRVTIPDVIGMDEDEAREALRDAGLTGSVQDVGSSRPEGTVVYTTPGVGSSIRTTTSVVLHVSSGFTPAATQPQPQPQPQPAQPAPAQQPAAPPPPPAQPAPPAEPEPTEAAEPPPEEEAEPAPAPAPEPPPEEEAPPGQGPGGEGPPGQGVG
ncbi:MAG TPA: transglycosylase domain-containing protein [Ornithinimicrobium sp.]|nr:transglycosylase domain-containing protein [Ornithinimicrobium sp.]